MSETEVRELLARVGRLEDEPAIRKVVLSYGPAADAGLTSFAPSTSTRIGPPKCVMRREGDRSYLWRVSAVRWDLERSGSTWRVRKRTNRLLDETGGGRELFKQTLGELFGEGPR